MISRLIGRLPGSPAVKALLVVVAVLATLALLGLFYEWLGSTFLDTGGQIG
ncbi:MAG: hypothetical protein MUP76_09190 [Acidimicrobiia bacterium]|nr:hypothetical protein [Acidimicrobiia bacterium]